MSIIVMDSGNFTIHQGTNYLMRKLPNGQGYKIISLSNCASTGNREKSGRVQNDTIIDIRKVKRGLDKSPHRNSKP